MQPHLSDDDPPQKRAFMLALSYMSECSREYGVERLPASIPSALKFHQLLIRCGYRQEDITFMHDQSKVADLLPSKDNILRQIALFVSSLHTGDRIVSSHAVTVTAATV